MMIWQRWVRGYAGGMKPWNLYYEDGINLLIGWAEPFQNSTTRNVLRLI